MANIPKPQKKSKHFKSEAVKQDEIKKRWAKDGFSCELWTDPPGQKWEGYVHEVDERICVVEGELELEMNGTSCELYSSEEAFIPARTTHSVRNIGGTAAKWLYGYKKSNR